VVKYDDGTVLQNCTITTAVFVCLTCVKGHLVKDIRKDVFPVYCCNCHEGCLNWVQKFPQGCSKLEYDDRPVCTVETVTNAAVESGVSNDLH
jgi:hypothetical protein